MAAGTVKKRTGRSRVNKPTSITRRKKSNPTPLSDLTFTKAAVDEAAYFSWLDRGCPMGDDWADWFKAENELMNQK